MGPNHTLESDATEMRFSALQEVAYFIRSEFKAGYQVTIPLGHVYQYWASAHGFNTQEAMRASDSPIFFDEVRFHEKIVERAKSLGLDPKYHTPLIEIMADANGRFDRE